MLPSAKRAAALKALKKRANTKGSSLNNHIKKVTGAKSHMFNGAGRQSAPGKSLSDEFINYVNANLADIAGGSVKTTTASGATAASGRWIQEGGNPELLQL